MTSDVYYPSEPPFGPVLNGTQVVVFYHYRPNKPAGFAFLALFAIATLAHLVYLFRLRAWFFIPLVLGGIGMFPETVRLPLPLASYIRATLPSPAALTLASTAEVFGYYGRAWSADEPNLVGPWILQNFLLLSAAPLIAATIYMTLGRLILALDAARHSIISPRWLAKIYMLIDVACLGTQIAGTVLPASGDEAVMEISRNVVLGGLVAQVVALGFFVFMTWHARRGIRKGKVWAVMVDPGLRWENHFRALEAVTCLVIVRSLVRLVEYAQGEDGFVRTHEVFIYLFDAALMLLAMVVYLVLHPARLIRDARGAGGGRTVPDGHVELGDGGWSARK